MMDEIKGFQGEFRFLSNFVPAEVMMDGIQYSSTEHAYQAAKTLDPEERLLIQQASTPGQAKRLGKQLKQRADWNEVKDDIMRNLLFQKFNIPHLKKLLLATGDAYIEETNTWNDTYWGVCRGNGQNKLGRLLMEIRAELKALL